MEKLSRIARTVAKIGIGVLLLLAMFALTSPKAHAEDLKFKILTKTPDMIICDQGVVTLKARVTPAQRGRVVFLSRWNTGAWRDDSKSRTNSAGIVELRFKTSCVRGWVGTRDVTFSLFSLDRDTNKWDFSKTFKTKLYRLAGFKTLGFEECTALPVGTDCIVAAYPASGAFDVSRDNYFIEVWALDPETGSFVERLTIYDEYDSIGKQLEILDNPFAFGIVSSSAAYSSEVVMILSDSKGDYVAWSKEYPIAWG